MKHRNNKNSIPAGKPNPPTPEKPIPYRIVDLTGTRGAPGNEGQYSGAVQPIDLIIAQKLDFCEGSVVKYICRWKRKGGILDLKKARQYLDWIIENAEKKSITKLNQSHYRAS